MDHRPPSVSFDKLQTDHTKRLWRPFMGCGNDELFEIGQRALKDRDIEIPVTAWPSWGCAGLR